MSRFRRVYRNPLSPAIRRSNPGATSVKTSAVNTSAVKISASKTWACLLVLMLTATTAKGATIHADGTTCTLADAIVAANTDAATGGCPKGDLGMDTIVLDADVTLTAIDGSSTLHVGLAAGLPDVTDDLTIAAGLGSVIQRDPTFTCDAATADPVFRFLNLEAGSLTLEQLRFENGCAVAGTLEGGGIWAEDSTVLTLDGVMVTDFGGFATSGSLRGGFIYTDGDSLNVSGSSFDGISVESMDGSLDGGVIYTFSNTSTSSIANTVFSDISITTDRGIDGGVINFRADTVIADSVFEDLTLSNGDSNLQGGALYSANSSTLILERTTFRRFVGESEAGIQGGAIYTTIDDLILSDVVFSDFDMTPDEECQGGALNSTDDGPFQGLIVERIICTSGGDLEGAAFHFTFGAEPVIRDCVFRDNEGSFGGNGSGGALYIGTSFLGVPDLDIERCAFINNRLAPASSMVDGNASGGAVSAERISFMRNVTFSGNVAEAGDGIEAVADGGSALGGALHLQEKTSTSFIGNVTFTGNQAIAGTGADGFADGSAGGAGIYLAATHTAEIIGSIFTNNTVTDDEGVTNDEDCDSDGTFTSLGFNLVGNPEDSCGFSAFGDLIGIDPGLYPVDDYGCDTPLFDGSCVPTAAIDQTSWAVDWGSCADAAVVVDARGLDRRQDIIGVTNLSDSCDVGAFEARDSDGDGVTDLPDLCPNIADSDQSDSDDDQVGDACDACEGDDASGDSDGDLVCDDSDVCAGFDDGVDSDADTVPDGCDICVGDDASGDTDNDLVCDDSDVCAGSDDAIDTDLDGVPDGCDVCVGDDASGDSDGDGLCDDSDASVGNRVWLDDGNGIQDGGEVGIAGVTVNLYDSGDQLLDTTVTGDDGDYGFAPGPGTYYLEFMLPADMAFAPRDRGPEDGTDSDANIESGTTALFTLAAGQVDLSRDAGLEPAVIGNRVWLDENADGRQQPGEVGLAGVTVRLLDPSDAEVASTTTAADGIYGFPGIAAGDYRIEVVLPTDAVFSIQDVDGATPGPEDLIDSDVDPGTGRSELFSYEAGTASRSWDAGLRLLPFFSDGFVSGDLSAWSSVTP